MRTTPLRILNLALVLSLVGCVHESDVELRNPLLAGAVDTNRIVKPHEYVENHRGLPRGSVADTATLLSIDAQQICFGLTMHELDPIDFREMEVELKTPKGESAGQARVDPTPVTFQSYEGLVPEVRVTGEETVCSRRDGNGICVAWQTRPTHATTMVPGEVRVYEAQGRLCFDNRQLVTASTEQVSLLVKMRRRMSQGGGFGFFGAGGGSKEMVFRWGFPGSKK
jgi:hypothetical protein